MALFAKKKTEETEKKELEEEAQVKPARNASASVAGGAEKKSEKKEEKKEEKKGEKREIRSQIEKITKDIILEPWITEKSHTAMAENKYIFRIDKAANKFSVKKAVETMYNVSVIDINIVNIPPKKRNYGRYKGEKSGYKKAIVTLKEGEKIELFKGV